MINRVTFIGALMNTTPLDKNNQVNLVFLIFLLLAFFAGMSICFFYQKKRVEKETRDKTPSAAPINLNHFPVLQLENGSILYRNDAFNTRFPEYAFKELGEICPFLDLNKDRQVHSILGVDYDIHIVSSDDDNTKEVYFVDMIKPEVNNLIGGKAASVHVGLYFIDNYEEAFDAMDEATKPLITAVIDRYLNSYAQSMDGIIKKFEKDKYLLVFTKEHLDVSIENKFDILKRVREIELGNKMPITLSIGIGIDHNSLSQSMDFARAAIDLALGRGGDQAVIKEGDTYQFFGGKSKEKDNNTRVRARVKAYVLEELIAECENVIIMGHRYPDLDCIGAGVGVYNIVRSIGKSCNIILNTVSSSIKELYNQLLLEDIYQDCFITSSQAFERFSQNTLIVIVDCHRPSIMECPELCEHADKIVVFDHHRKSAEFIANPVLSYHEPYASSTSELITEMMQHVKQKINLLEVEADALLAGITVDTKNFFIKTGTKTFEAAAYLKRHGAEPVRVRMFMQNNMESYKAKAAAVNDSQVYGENMAITICVPYAENPSLIAAQVADDLLNIAGIEASFALCEDREANQVLISARSLGNINVQRIMEKMGGGGHQTAAGVQVNNEDINEVIKILEGYIDEYLEEI